MNQRFSHKKNPRLRIALERLRPLRGQAGASESFEKSGLSCTVRNGVGYAIAGDTSRGERLLSVMIKFSVECSRLADMGCGRLPVEAVWTLEPYGGRRFHEQFIPGVTI